MRGGGERCGGGGGSLSLPMMHCSLPGSQAGETKLTAEQLNRWDISQHLAPPPSLYSSPSSSTSCSDQWHLFSSISCCFHGNHQCYHTLGWSPGLVQQQQQQQ